MPYKTFTAGEILTASDVMTYLMNQVVVVCTSGTRPSSPTEGRVIFETDTNKLMAYDGSAWQELNMTDTPRVRAVREATQSLTTGSTIAIQYDTAPQNPRTMWSAGNPSRLTVPAGGGGTYVIGGAAQFAPAATGSRQLAVDISGTTQIRQTIPSIGSGLATRVNISYVCTVAAGEYVEITARQDSGGTINLETSENHPSAWMVRVAP
jgi:hypothetical protein